MVIRWAYDQWHACLSKVTLPWFDHCFMELINACSKNVDIDHNNVLQSKEQGVQENNMMYTRAALHNFYHLEDEGNIVKQISLKKVGRDIAVDLHFSWYSRACMNIFFSFKASHLVSDSDRPKQQKNFETPKWFWWNISSWLQINYVNQKKHQHDCWPTV